MISNILSILFPSRCAICGEVLKIRENGACSKCRSLVQPIVEPLCKKCGKPMGNMQDEFCYDCSRTKHLYEEGIALWLYDNRMKKSIAAYKYGGSRENCQFYVEQMGIYLGDHIKKFGAAGLVPVPLFRDKMKLRGFNQAEYLARGLGQCVQLPLFDHLLLRTVKTIPQKKLSHDERRHNLEHAFEVDLVNYEKLGRPRSLVLVDDIYTTGNTIDSCCKVLKMAGVERLYFVCLCIGRDC